MPIIAAYAGVHPRSIEAWQTKCAPMIDRADRQAGESAMEDTLSSKHLDQPVAGPPKRQPVPWSTGAEEVYFAFSKKMDDFESSDRKRYELGMRACENAVRWATIVAVGRGSPTVDKEDIAWAIAWTERSVEAACGALNATCASISSFQRCVMSLAKPSALPPLATPANKCQPVTSITASVAINVGAMNLIGLSLTW
jgi:hypothetical protein